MIHKLPKKPEPRNKKGPWLFRVFVGDEHFLATYVGMIDNNPLFLDPC